MALKGSSAACAVSAFAFSVLEFQQECLVTNEGYTWSWSRQLKVSRWCRNRTVLMANFSPVISSEG